MVKLNRLQETLFVLYKCSSTVERVNKALEEHYQKGPLFALHHYSHNIAYYMIMEAVSFLEEYDNFFTPTKVEPEYKQRVTDVRKVVKPLYKKIREWKDLDSYRNSVIAHGWRDKKKGHVLIASKRKTYDVPRSMFEYQLLKDLVKYVFHVIELEFKVESNQAIFYGYSESGKEQQKKNYSDINTELKKILDEMNATSKLLGKDYDIRISGYNFDKTSAS